MGKVVARLWNPHKHWVFLLWRRGGIRTPGRSFGPYNGLANSRFHTLLFGINSLRSDELPHCWAKSPCSGAFVQLLCNQNFNALPCRSTPFTTVNYGESYGSGVRRLAKPVLQARLSVLIRRA